MRGRAAGRVMVPRAGGDERSVVRKRTGRGIPVDVEGSEAEQEGQQTYGEMSTKEKDSGTTLRQQSHGGRCYIEPSKEKEQEYDPRFGESLLLSELLGLSTIP